MLRRASEGAGASVDTAAIAAAVAGALTIPTADENALAVADLLTIPTAAENATAVGAQAACAAALTAAAGVAIPSVAQVQSGLATSSAVSTLQTTCNALPSSANVLTQVQAGIAAETGQFGALTALLQPTNGPYQTGEMTGNTSHLVLGFQSSKYITLYGFTLTSDIACTVTLKSGATSISEPTPIQAGGNWTLSPGVDKTFRCNYEDALLIACSSSAAKLRLTYWAAYTDY